MERTETEMDLIAEFKENGLPDLAAHLQEYGITEAIEQAETDLAQIKHYPDDPYLPDKHNTEVALERLNDAEYDVRNERITEVTGEVFDALEKLYEACEGDETQFGEVMYEVEKSVRRNR